MIAIFGAGRRERDPVRGKHRPGVLVVLFDTNGQARSVLREQSRSGLTGLAGSGTPGGATVKRALVSIAAITRDASVRQAFSAGRRVSATSRRSLA